MSAHQLPEDLSRWPDNAYELLGVAPGVGPRDLRRAYTRLIRTYKPEQFPEHFRRIREAYETVLQYAEFFGDGDAAPETAATPAPERPVPDRERKGDPLPAPAADETETVPLQHPYRPPDISELWQMACNGQAAAPYRQLVQMDETNPGRTDVCQAAYWLLVLEPELDSGREPCDWLTRGLAGSGLAGPLHELYHREIAENPAEALSQRCTHLLRVPAPAGLVADLVEWRWQAAAKLQSLVEIVPPDLEFLRPRLPHEDEETWLHLLLAAAGLLAIAPPAWGMRDLTRACQEEIAKYEHLHHRLAYAFDQYEFQQEIAMQIVRLYRADKEPRLAAIGGLVERAQNCPFPETRPLLLSFLEQLTQRPAQVLRCFDQVREAAPAVLAEFGNLLQQLADSVPAPEDDRGPDDFAELVGAFLAELSTTDHEKFRIELLRFCVREAMSPQQVGDCIALDCTALAQQVRDDWPLQHAWLAYHIMGR